MFHTDVARTLTRGAATATAQFVVLCYVDESRRQVFLAFGCGESTR